MVRFERGLFYNVRLVQGYTPYFFGGDPFTHGCSRLKDSSGKRRLLLTKLRPAITSIWIMLSPWFLVGTSVWWSPTKWHLPLMSRVPQTAARGRRLYHQLCPSIRWPKKRRLGSASFSLQGIEYQERSPRFVNLRNRALSLGENGRQSCFIMVRF